MNSVETVRVARRHTTRTSRVEVLNSSLFEKNAAEHSVAGAGPSEADLDPPLDLIADIRSRAKIAQRKGVQDPAGSVVNDFNVLGAPSIIPIQAVERDGAGRSS